MEPMSTLILISSVVNFSPSQGNITLFHEFCPRIDFLNLNSNFKESTDMDVSDFSVPLEPGSIGFYVCRSGNYTYKHLKMKGVGPITKADHPIFNYYKTLAALKGDLTDSRCILQQLKSYNGSENQTEDYTKFVDKENEAFLSRFHEATFTDHCNGFDNSETKESDVEKETKTGESTLNLMIAIIIILLAIVIFLIICLLYEKKKNKIIERANALTPDETNTSERFALNDNSELLDPKGDGEVAGDLKPEYDPVTIELDRFVPII